MVVIDVQLALVVAACFFCVTRLSDATRAGAQQPSSGERDSVLAHALMRQGTQQCQVAVSFP